MEKDGDNHGPFTVKEYVDEQYGGLGVQCRGVSQTKVTVSLPKCFDDLSSLIYDLGEKFGATCDLTQSEEAGASLVVWHQGPPPSGGPGFDLPPCSVKRVFWWTCGALSAGATLFTVASTLMSLNWW